MISYIILHHVSYMSKRGQSEVDCSVLKRTKIISILKSTVHICSSSFVQKNRLITSHKGFETGLVFPGKQCIVPQTPSPPYSVLFFCSCDKVYPKQEVRFFFYLLGRIVTWNVTLIHWIKIDHVLNYHDWELRICPWIVPQLSIRINYNGTWSILIQWLIGLW